MMVCQFRVSSMHRHERPSHMSAMHLALLRGINVGGKNMLPMKELRDMFVAAGCDDVQTYIQSGNVIFRAEPNVVAPLADSITARIAERFGYRVPLVVRTAKEVGAVIRHNPFIAAGAAEETLHVLFLAGRPEAEHVDALDPDRSPPDEFAVRGQEVYLRLPNGAGRTKLTNAYFDTKLATVSTGRNWRTVTTLFALTEQ
ncbi:MAG: DUF1697 domain-containing protein [Thermomicrobiales bacterium]